MLSLVKCLEIDIPPLLYIFHQKNSMSITCGHSACFNQAVDLFRKPSFIHNAQFTVHLTPAPDSGSPSFCDFKGSQIQCFQQRRIAWKYTSSLIGGIP